VTVVGGRAATYHDGMATTLSSAIQEYLESLYWLGEAGIERTPTNLARAMRVSPPSVSEMLRRLQREGLIARGPGTRIALTEEGERVARHVVSRHRLIEAFLVRVMGIPWDEVHEEAEAFEMGVTAALEARMLEMIGEVRTCPHGHPIGDFPREPGVPLTGVPAGSTVRVLRFENEDHDLLRLFRREGVEPGTEYTIVGFDGDRARLKAAGGATAALPLSAARTISVAVRRRGDGDPAEDDPESLATAYLLGETNWSR
jgi:DtxR family transcriptional regulator, Mn-dependent transcriptional regulator